MFSIKFHNYLQFQIYLNTVILFYFLKYVRAWVCAVICSNNSITISYNIYQQHHKSICEKSLEAVDIGCCRHGEDVFMLLKQTWDQSDWFELISWIETTLICISAIERFESSHFMTACLLLVTFLMLHIVELQHNWNSFLARYKLCRNLIIYFLN